MIGRQWIVITPILVASATSAVAEPTIDFSGQVRAREEMRHELFTPADPMGTASFDEAHLRSRLRATVSIHEQLGAVLELQDVRLLGGEGSTVADTEGLDLKRGFLIIEPAAADVAIRVGRWVMAYGDQRLIGHLEWVDQGRSYDGVHVAYKADAGFLDGFAVRVRETLADKDDLHFGGLYGGLDVATGTRLELYALGLRDSMAPNQSYATIGSRVALSVGRFEGRAEVAVQAGETGDTELFAFATAANAAVIVAKERAIRISGEVAFASGDDDPTDAENQTFQTLFPTNHIHYGHADLAAWQNLIAFRLGVSLQPTESTSAALTAHHLRLADPAGGWYNAAGALVRPGDATASSDLGNELDLVIGWKPLSGLALQAGLAVFAGGGFVSDTGGGANATFAYLQGSATF